jgi:hypothetical protein
VTDEVERLIRLSHELTERYFDAWRGEMSTLYVSSPLQFNTGISPAEPEWAWQVAPDFDLWGWAPGPIVARPYYAPALVAFFSAGPFSIGVGLGAPRLGWTPLGWGEPCRPWWGPRNFAGRPRWLGWGGPRVTYNQTTINNVNFYQNSRARDGVVVVDRDRFARGPVAGSRVASARWDRMRAVDGALPVRADGARVVGGAERARRPPRAHLDRPVVATRESAVASTRGFQRRPGAPPKPAAQLVPSPRDTRDARDRAVERSRGNARTGTESVAAPPRTTRGGEVRRSDARNRQQDTARVAPSATQAAREAAVRGAQRVAREPELRRPVAPTRSQRSVDRGGESRRQPSQSDMRAARQQSAAPQRAVAAQRSRGPDRALAPQRSPAPQRAATPQRPAVSRAEAPRASREATRRAEQPAPRASRERAVRQPDRVQSRRASREAAAPRVAPSNVAPSQAAAAREAAVQSRGAGAPNPSRVAVERRNAVIAAGSEGEGGRGRGSR